MIRQEIRRSPTWPLRAAGLGLVLLLFLFLLPALLLPGKGREREEDQPLPSPLPTATLPLVEPTVASPVSGWDQSQTLRLLRGDGQVEKLTLRDYLWRVTAAEMPASFQLEALKAQTVAARTYCLYQRSGTGDKHPGADVCDDYTCCQAYLTPEQAAVGWGAEAETYAAKINRALLETDGLLCLYEGKPIDAVFFSSTAGRTSDAVSVWGTEIPYLSAVDSPEGEEVPGWQTVVTFSLEDFSARFRGTYPEADLTVPPQDWFRDLVLDDSGVVTTVTIGGVSLSGGQARSLFGLRSAHFTAAATEEGVTFWVTGYGHAVGMSQYGANAMAGEGKNFQEILEWYYTGVTVGGLVSPDTEAGG